MAARATQDLDWQRLGSVPAAALTEARLQLHWAAQTIVAAADALLEPKPDDRHTTMSWDSRRRALLGHRTDNGLRLALLLEELALAVIDDDDNDVHTISLAGQSLDTSMAWVAQAMETDRSLFPRSYDMPAHELSQGGRFTIERGEALDELTRWFATAHQALGELVTRADGAMPVATWPHHFDTGGIVRLDRQRPLDKAPHIAFGLSPGDDSYTEPYYYVTPWPLPGNAQLPTLPHGGIWRDQGWSGAVLTATALLGVGAERKDHAARANAVRDFLDVAIAAGRAIIPPST